MAKGAAKIPFGWRVFLTIPDGYLQPLEGPIEISPDTSDELRVVEPAPSRREPLALNTTGWHATLTVGQQLHDIA